MGSHHDLESLDSPKRQFQSEVASYIAQRRWELYSHAAVDEAFKDVSVETLQKQAQLRAQLRRTVSCDSLPTATNTLDRIQTHGIQAKPEPVQKTSELRDVFQNPDDDLERLQEAIMQYETSVPENLRTKVDFSAKHSWDEVVKAVETVRDDHYEAKGFRERVRHSCSHLLTKHATAVMVWTEILPSQNEFFSPICGGFKLIFGAAAKMKRIRDEIYLALEEIPDVLDQANNKLEMFKQHGLQESSPLFYCGNNLMSSVLVALIYIVEELTKSASKKTFKSLVKQDRYGQSLTSALATMRYNAEKLAAAAENSSTAALLDTREKVEVLSNEVMHLRDENRSLNLYTARQANLTQGNQAEGRTLVKRMNGKLDSILSSARNLESVSLQKEVVEATLIDLLPRFLESAERIDARKGGVREGEEEARRRNFEISFEYRQKLKREILSSVLRYDATVVEVDTQKKNFGAALSAGAQDRAVALLKAPRLKQFMSKPCSSILFANANCNPDSSPTAYVSATLASCVKQPARAENVPEQRLFALTFYCGRHTDKYDTYAGPCGLMRSFVSQLLSYYAFSLPYLRMVQGVDCEDIEDLCNLFETLVSRLPRSDIVFCVVDSFTVYETRTAYEKDAGVLIESLVALAHEAQEGPVIKLWMSASSGSRNLRSLLSAEEILSLPPKVPQTGGLFTSKLSMEGSSLFSASQDRDAS